MLGLAVWDLFLKERYEPKYKIRPSSAFDSQYSIVPLFQHSFWDEATSMLPVI